MGDTSGLSYKFFVSSQRWGQYAQGQGDKEAQQDHLQQTPLRPVQKPLFGFRAPSSQRQPVLRTGLAVVSRLKANHIGITSNSLSGDSFLNLSLAKALFVPGTGRVPYRPKSSYFRAAPWHISEPLSCIAHPERFSLLYIAPEF